jgi:hypothetical protein
MRKRRPLHCERLEQRELLADSFSVGVLPLDWASLAPLPARAAPLPPLGVAFAPGAAAEGQAGTESRLSCEAVGAFFADHATQGGWTHPSAPPASGETGLEFESQPASGWNSDAEPTAKALPAADEAEFWAFLRNYARKAIRREEFVRGPLRDHSDIVQQIYVEWREEVPASADVHAHLLDQGSAERLAFRTVVRRVLDRSRYDENKQRRRAEMTEQETPDDKATRTWADLQIDLAQGVAQLAVREREILSLRRERMTFEEIGDHLGMPRQRVFEAYTELLDRLTALYRD